MNFAASAYLYTMPDFSRRSTTPEWMDDPAADPAAVHQALRQLRVINTWLGGWDVTTKGLDYMLRHATVPPTHKLRILDAGCGGGDMLRHIARWAKRRNRAIQLLGLDINPLMLQVSAAATAGLPVTLVARSVLDDVSDLAPDISTHCLFAHHFDGDNLVQLVRHLHQSSRLGTVINDLHRHPLAYYGYRLACFLFGASPMVRHDGSVSVLRSLTRAEWQVVLQAAGIQHYRISWHWAWRWQILTFHNPTPASA